MDTIWYVYTSYQIFTMQDYQEQDEKLHVHYDIPVWMAKKGTTYINLLLLNKFYLKFTSKSIQISVKYV